MWNWSTVSSLLLVLNVVHQFIITTSWMINVATPSTFRVLCDTTSSGNCRWRQGRRQICYRDCAALNVKPLPWEKEDCDTDDTVSNNYFSSALDTSDPTSSSSDAVLPLLRRLSNRPELHISQLAKLAVAFSPPDRPISLSNVRDVSILSIDNDRIEIAAVVVQDLSGNSSSSQKQPEQQHAVSLYVPVTFPQSCSGLSGDEEELCIMDNMNELENVAESRVIQINAKLHDEQWDREHPELDLFSVDHTSSSRAAGATSGGTNGDVVTSMQLPSWWIPSHTRGPLMIEECDLIRSLLNDDDSGFGKELQGLASAAHEMAIDADGASERKHGELIGSKVEKAIVTNVGPAGICLRARVVVENFDRTTNALREMDEGDEETTKGDQKREEAKRTIVDVAWPFSTTANDPNDLRASVLGAFSMVVPAE